MAVNLEAADREPPRELGNHFALVLAVLPHASAGFRDRLLEVHRRMTRIRRSWEPVLTHALARGIARSPSPLGIAASQSAGLVENLPTAAKNVGVGNAARQANAIALCASR